METAEQTAHKGVLDEIEKSRVISLYQQNTPREDFDFSSGTEQSKGAGVARAKSQIAPKRSYPLRQANVQSWKKRPSSTVCDSQHDLERIRLNSRDGTTEVRNNGMLYKTSRGKITSELTRGQHEHRQYRRFQLTEHSLEYSQLLQRVCWL